MPGEPPEPPDSSRLGDLLGDLYERGEETIDHLRSVEPALGPALDENLRALSELDRLATGRSPTEAGPVRRFGDFLLLREVGRGGMGIVFEAEQISLRRRVALKVLHPGVALDERALHRFRAEARTASRLHHTNLVPVHAMGNESGTWWYAMEYVEGPTLADLVHGLRSGDADGAEPRAAALGSPSEGRAYYERLAMLCAGVAEALQTAHSDQVIHRDVKPANLILAADGTLRLTDFGLAFASTGRSFNTRTGGVVGTPVYMSPEQALGSTVDGRSDVYSLGATLYEVLTLRPPVRGGGSDLLRQARTFAAPRRLDRRIPRDLETIVLKTLERQPRLRYPTAAALAQDLRSFAAGAGVRARRVGPIGRLGRAIRRRPGVWTLVGCILGLAAASAGLATRAEHERRARGRFEYDMWVDTASAACVHGWRRVEPCAGPPEPAEESAALLFARAIAATPDRPEAYLGRALACGPLDRRLEDLDRALRLGLAERTHRLAEAFVHLTGSHGVAGTAAGALASAPGESHVPLDSFLAGSLRFGLGRPDEALADLTRAVHEAPAGSSTWVRSLVLRSQVHHRLGDLRSASEDLSVVVAAQGPARPGLRSRLGILFRRLGQPERGEAAFEEALREARRLGHPGSWLDVCGACVRDANRGVWLDRATKEALDLHPEDECLTGARAEALGVLGRAEEGLAIVERGLARDPGSASLSVARASLLLQAGKAEAALSALDSTRGGPGAAERAAMIRWQALRRLGRADEALAVVDALLAKHPYEPGYHSERGAILCDDLERYEGAVEAFEQAIRLAPGWASLYRNLNIARWKGGDREGAVTALRQAVEVDPNSFPAWTSLGNRLRELGDREGAIAAFREALRVDPENVEVWFGLGNLLSASDAAASAAAFGKVVALQPRLAKGHFNLGNALSQQGLVDEAIAAYEEALACAPDHAEARTNLGTALETKGDSAAAERAYREAIARNPTLLVPRNHLGRLLGLLHRHPEAVEVWRECVRLQPADAKVRGSLAGSLRAAGQHEEAETEIRAAIALGPAPDLLVELGNILSDRGVEKQALEAYGEAVRLDPTYAAAYFERGVHWREKGEFARAVEELRTAVRIVPDDGQFRYELGCMLTIVGEHEEAVRHLTEACRLRPEHAEGHNNLGSAEMRRERWEQALLALTRAVEVRPGYALAHKNMGLCHEALANDEEAVKSYARAAESDRYDPEAPKFLGTVHERARRFPETLSAYLEWARRAPRSPEAVRAVGHALVHLGRLDEALESYRRAAELAPEDLHAEEGVTEILLCQGRHDEAVRSCDAALARLGVEPSLIRAKVTALRALGRLEEACRIAEDATKGPVSEAALLDVAHLRAVAGNRAGAEEILRDAKERLTSTGMYMRARVHAVLGDRKAVLEWIRKAETAGYYRPASLPPDPEFAPFAEHAQFRDAIARLARAAPPAR